MSDQEVIIEVARISKLNLSKEVRADNPYQGYDTFFIIMDMEGKMYQYFVSNTISRVLSVGSEIMTVVRPGDKIKAVLMSVSKKANQEQLEPNRISKIISFVPKM